MICDVIPGPLPKRASAKASEPEIQEPGRYSQIRFCKRGWVDVRVALKAAEMPHRREMSRSAKSHHLVPYQEQHRHSITRSAWAKSELGKPIGRYSEPFIFKIVESAQGSSHTTI